MEPIAENTRLKIKIGDYEFEAEGPVATVQAQLDAFKELVANAPKVSPTTAAANDEPPSNREAPPPKNDQLRLDAIMKVEARIVSLTVNAASVEDAIRLILLGQKFYRSNDTVSGAEIIDGLKQSGIVVDRVDRQMKKIADEGHVIVVGIRRATRYRLTNAGVNRAQEIARELIATVA